MKLNNIKLQHFANIKRWKVLDQKASDQQLFYRLGHINPEVHIDPEKGVANKVLKQEQRGNVIETTSTVGISTQKGRLSDFYDGLASLAQAGFMKGYTIQDIQELRSKTNKIMPEECDFWTDISIADYKEAKTAVQALDNISAQFSKGFADVPVPGAVDDMTLKDAFKNPLVRAEAKKQGVSEASIDKALEEIKKASSQAVEQMKKANIRYKLGKFDKYHAVYCIPPIIETLKPKVKKKEKSIEIKNPDGSVRKIQAGGGSDTRVKFPPNAFEKEDYPVGGRLLQAIQVNRYLITGGILTALNCIPSGKLFCQSLTKFKTNTQTTHEGDMTFIDHFIVPVDSNLEKEGYLNREETEGIILKLASLLK